MKAVIQRVKGAELTVDGQLISKIGVGLVVFFGVKVGDDISTAEYFIKKIPSLRIFEDENGKMNKSVIDVNGEILFVSQFTLYGDTTGGNRPSFIEAERPEQANKIYEHTANAIRAKGVPVKTGVFGADMQISQLNDGPVTIIMEK